MEADLWPRDAHCIARGSSIGAARRGRTGDRASAHGAAMREDTHRRGDRKAWQQAIVLLVGLRSRNDFGNEDLTAAVGAALKRSSTSRKY